MRDFFLPLSVWLFWGIWITEFRSQWLFVGMVSPGFHRTPEQCWAGKVGSALHIFVAQWYELSSTEQSNIHSLPSVCENTSVYHIHKMFFPLQIFKKLKERTWHKPADFNGLSFKARLKVSHTNRIFAIWW